jgi:radical SAM superfamily enzyme YgiQ (UPF0313 family)
MRVLLISTNTEEIHMPTWPVGLACVGAAAREAGHEVEMLDLMRMSDWSGPVAKSVSRFSPQAIGMSVRNIDDQNLENPIFLLERVRDVVSQCKRLSNAPIVLGGAGFSIFPMSVLEYLKADMGIQGEGEGAFLKLLEAMEKPGDFSSVPGLWLRPEGLQTSPRFESNLDRFPLPEVQTFAPPAANRDQFLLPVQTRRGCPMNCAYCSTASIEGTAWRHRSASRVVDWLSKWAAEGFRKFYFVDNTFNLPEFYALDLCSHMAEANLGAAWQCILYPHKLNKSLVQVMAKAGCSEVALGFESGCEDILRALNKRFRSDDVRRAALVLGDHGIRRMGFLLLGGPGETRATVEQSLAFADSLNLEAVKITVGIRIYPHTRLAKLAVEEGVISPEDDLLFPRFYLARGLEEWVFETVESWMSQRPHWTR